MHEPVTYDNVLYFIIGAIILCWLFFVSPKLMRFLDEWVDRRNREKQKAKKATDKSEE